MYLEKTEPRSVADAATRVFYCGLAICAVIYGIACSDPKTHNGPVPSPSPQEREHLRSVVASLPAENFDHLMVEGGNFGDGVRQSWMDAMKRRDVKAAKVEVHLTWFFGPRSPKATEVLYFSDYGGAQQVVDEALLSQLHHDGLEDALKRAALAHGDHATGS